MPRTATCSGHTTSNQTNRRQDGPDANTHTSRHAESSSGGHECDGSSSNKATKLGTLELATTIAKEDPSLSGKQPRLAILKVYRSSGGCSRLLVPVVLALCCAMAALGPIRFRSRRSATAAAANEMFDDANESPAGNDGFNDDDDDDEGAMDASASGDYPEADGGGEDPDDDPDGGESRQSGSWMLPGAHAASPRLMRRTRRDLDDVASEVQRRLAAEIKRQSIRLNSKPEDLEFAMDDGDVDAWVHDGVDDIHIDPETRQAASQLSHDERSIDAEYEPHQGNEQDVVLNGTRTTTISEVIPMRNRGGYDDEESQGAGGHNGDNTRISARYAAAPPLMGASLYLPAAYLSMDQAVRLMDSAAASASGQNAANERLRRWAHRAPDF